jgi:RHS repeat-associated protein
MNTIIRQCVGCVCYGYDAFGKPYKGDFSNGVGLGYTGKPYDTVTGMYNYGYRDYQPEVARFTTVDPIRDGANWFAYVNNDPVNYVDLWGLTASDRSRGGILDDHDKNAKYDTVQEMLDKLDENYNNYTHNGYNTAYYNNTVFIDAPYEPKGGDRVETALSDIEKAGATVLHPANASDLSTVLNQGNFNGVDNVVVSGGHGSAKDPGQVGKLDFSDVSVTNGNLSGIDVYFPDCSLGTSESQGILQNALGPDVNIHAKDYDTLETSVRDFLNTAADTGISQRVVDSSFNGIRKSGTGR